MRKSVWRNEKKIQEWWCGSGGDASTLRSLRLSNPSAASILWVAPALGSSLSLMFFTEIGIFTTQQKEKEKREKENVENIEEEAKAKQKLEKKKI